jgi:hypothetical protein
MQKRGVSEEKAFVMQESATPKKRPETKSTSNGTTATSRWRIFEADRSSGSNLAPLRTSRITEQAIVAVICIILSLFAVERIAGRQIEGRRGFCLARMCLLDFGMFADRQWQRGMADFADLVALQLAADQRFGGRSGGGRSVRGASRTSAVSCCSVH